MVADAEPVAQARHHVVLILCRCAHFDRLLQWLAHIGVGNIDFHRAPSQLLGHSAAYAVPHLRPDRRLDLLRAASNLGMVERGPK
ncbi:MAG: hypothetical protein WAL26_01895 [Mycobacterium sp.]